MPANDKLVPSKTGLRRARALATVTPPIALIAAAFIAGSLSLAVPTDHAVPGAAPVSVDSPQPSQELEPSLQRLDANDHHG